MGRKSEVQNKSHKTKIKESTRTVFISGGSRGESVFLSFLTFQASRGFPPWLIALSVFKANNSWLSLFHTACLWPTLHLITVIIQDNLLMLGSTDNSLNSVYNPNSPFPCNMTYSQVPGFRTWTTLGGH